MVDIIREFADKSIIISTCKAEDLDRIDVRCEVKKYEAGKKCHKLLPECTTVIIVGQVINSGDDVMRKGLGALLGDDFPSYRGSSKVASAITQKLQSMGFSARKTVGISIKNACVLSGIGVYGKNALIINPQHGTYIRYAAVLTNWIPDVYGQPLQNFTPCQNCDKCLPVCPGHCLEPYKVDGLKCMCTYVEKGQKPLQTLPMCSICQDVCPWNDQSISE